MKKNILLLVASLCLGIGTANAQYTDLLNFNGFNGSEPFGSLTLSGNVLFGSAYFGGVNDSGCIFSIHTDGTHYKDIFDFNGTNGSKPNSPITIVAGVLYGTASVGGAHDSGCIFSMDTNGHNYKDLFDFSGPNGKTPYNTLLYTSGTLYGVADGGVDHLGCIFTIDTNGTGYTDIFDFNGTNGEYPLGLTLSGNVLFGLTLYGGVYNYGTLYSVHTDGTNYEDLFDFDVSDGYYPGGVPIYSAGKLYGATSFGGANGDGLIFAVDSDGSNPKDLFDFNYTDGAQPEYAGGSFVLSGSTLYGEAYYGGTYDSGCVFAIDTNGGGYKDLFGFNGINGSNPEGSLTMIGNTLYGATAYGGPYHAGILFSFDTSVATIAAIHDTVCKGDTALLFVGGLKGATYSWSPGGATADSIHASPLTSTTYTVTSTQGISHYTNTVRVTVLPLPNLVVTGTSKLCVGSRDTLNASGGVGYLWSNGRTNSTIITGTINNDTVIYVTAYNNLGCSVTDSFKITAEICTGINEIQYKDLLQVYPNPSSGQFTIALSHPELVSGTQAIEIYNVLGEKVYSQSSISNYPLAVNLSNQPNGIYLYRVIAQTGALIGEGKVIVQR